MRQHDFQVCIAFLIFAPAPDSSDSVFNPHKAFENMLYSIYSYVIQSFSEYTPVPSMALLLGGSCGLIFIALYSFCLATGTVLFGIGFVTCGMVPGMVYTMGCPGDECFLGWNSRWVAFDENGFCPLCLLWLNFCLYNRFWLLVFVLVLCSANWCR